MRFQSGPICILAIFPAGNEGIVGIAADLEAHSSAGSKLDRPEIARYMPHNGLQVPIAVDHCPRCRPALKPIPIRFWWGIAFGCAVARNIWWQDKVQFA